MRKEWNGFATYYSSLGSNPNRAPAQALGSDVLLDGVDVNPGGTLAGHFGTTFTAPPGATTVTVSVPYVWAAAHTTSAFSLNLTPANMGSVSAQALCSPSTSVQTCSVSMAVTPGTVYGVVIANDGNYGSTNGAEMVLGRVKVTPTGATGLFGSSFERFSLWHGEMWGNTRSDTSQDGTPQESPFSYAVLNTTATTLVVQSECTATANAQTAYSVFVDGVAFGTAFPASTNVDDYKTFTLPPGKKQVIVVTSYQTTANNNFDSHTGTFLKALYVPPNTDSSLLLPAVAPSRQLLVYGDSIVSGSLSTTPSLNGIPILLRSRFYGNVVFESWGSRQLFQDIGGASGPSNMAKLVAYFAAAAPTEIYLAMGYNDYANATYKAAEFGAAEGSLMDALHAAIPQAKIWMQTLLLTNGSEATNNANGETPPNFRTQQTSACNARSWCNLVDGTTLVATGDISAGDHAHVLAASQRKYVDAILNVLETPSLSVPVPPYVANGDRVAMCAPWLAADTAATCVGRAVPTLLNGTAATADTTDTNYNSLLKYTTSGAANNAVGFSGPFTVATMNTGPIYTAIVRTDPSLITSTRIYVGLVASSLDQVSTLAGANGVNNCVFRYDTGLSDTAFVAESSDGTTASATATSTTVAAATTYVLQIDPRITGVCRFYINGVLAVSKNTNIPTGTTGLGEEASITGLAASARSMSIALTSIQQKGAHP
jgi:hypothetical protein